MEIKQLHLSQLLLYAKALRSRNFYSETVKEI